MAKSKKDTVKDGGGCEGVPAKTAIPQHEEKQDLNSGIIGIGMPMNEKELHALKEKAKELDQ